MLKDGLMLRGRMDQVSAVSTGKDLGTIHRDAFKYFFTLAGGGVWTPGQNTLAPPPAPFPVLALSPLKPAPSEDS